VTESISYIHVKKKKKKKRKNKNKAFLIFRRESKIEEQIERERNGKGGLGELRGQSTSGNGVRLLRSVLCQQARARRPSDRGHWLPGRPPAIRTVHLPHTLSKLMKHIFFFFSFLDLGLYSNLKSGL